MKVLLKNFYLNGLHTLPEFYTQILKLERSCMHSTTKYRTISSQVKKSTKTTLFYTLPPYYYRLKVSVDERGK